MLDDVMILKTLLFEREGWCCWLFGLISKHDLCSQALRRSATLTNDQFQTNALKGQVNRVDRWYRIGLIKLVLVVADTVKIKAPPNRAVRSNALNGREEPFPVIER